MNKKEIKIGSRVIPLDKKNITIGVIALVIVFLLGISIYLAQKDKAPDVVVNDDYAFIVQEYIVPPTLWAEYKYGDKLTDFDKQKVAYLFNEYGNEYFSNNFNLLGKKIPNDMLISNSFEEVKNISTLKNDKIIILTSLKDNYLMENIDDYIYLKKASEDVSSYGVYIVNYNEDEKKEFFEKVKEGYVLTNRNKEVNEFIKNLNKNVVLIVDENNVIQSAMDYAHVSNLSKMAMYAFMGDISVKDYVETFNEVKNNPKEITETYVKKTGPTKSYDTIYDMNSENNYKFFEIKGIVKDFIPSKIELVNMNTAKIVYTSQAMPDKVVTVQQKYVSGDFKEESKHNYVNQLSKDTTFYNVYGKSKDELYAFKLIRNNIYVYIESTTPLTISEIESIINSTF